jgi:photosystem II stability/assembly factor-like uncharacterized protein
MKYFTLILSLFITSQCFGQWEKFYEAENDNFYVLGLNEERLFIGAEFANVYRQSTDTNFDIKSLQGYGFLADIEFVNSQIGFASGGCYYTTAECPASTIFKTIDGGENLAMVAQLGGTGVVNDLEIINENKIFACSEYDGFHCSEDGGMTWNPVTISSSMLQYYNLQFINESIGFVTGQRYIANQGRYNVIFKTVDGGQNWSEIYEIPISDINFWNYYFVNENKGFWLFDNFCKELKKS